MVVVIATQGYSTRVPQQWHNNCLVVWGGAMAFTSKELVKHIHGIKQNMTEHSDEKGKSHTEPL